MSESDYDKIIDALVAAAPPLTEEQKRKLNVLLNSGPKSPLRHCGCAAIPCICGARTGYFTTTISCGTCQQP